MGESSKAAKAILVGLFLLILLAAIVAIFVFLVHKFSKPSYDHHLDSEELYRLIKEPLSSNIRPRHYFVDLDLTSKWYLSDDENHFTGNVKIVIHIGNTSVKYIALDSRNLHVLSLKAFKLHREVNKRPTIPTVGPKASRREVTRKPEEEEEEEEEEEIPVSRWFLYPPTDRLVVETAAQLDGNSLILLDLSFAGWISKRPYDDDDQQQQHEPAGLLKYNLKEGVVLATDGANRFHARSTFPCFDDVKFTSVFSLSVHHPSSSSSSVVLSNMRPNEVKPQHKLDITIFKTSRPLATRHLVVVAAAAGRSRVAPAVELTDVRCAVYLLFNDTRDRKKEVEVLCNDLRRGYEDVWDDQTTNIVVFPENITEPGIVTDGLISVQLPVPEEKLIKSMHWQSSLLRVKDANNSWIEFGLERKTVEKDNDYDTLADDFAHRKLNWNNEDIAEENQNFLRKKAHAIFRLLDKGHSLQTISDALKTIIKKRMTEDRKLMENLKMQITSDWHNKSEGRQRRELLEVWHKLENKKGEVRGDFNSTDIYEVMDAIEEKHKSTKSPISPAERRRMVASWMESADHPLLDVELAAEEAGDVRIKQRGLHHPHLNHTWVFPLEIMSGNEFSEKWMETRETTLGAVGLQGDLVANPRRRAYARVNYEGPHWQRLFARFDKLEAEVQRTLIQDLFSLAWQGGHVGYDVVAASLEQLTTPGHWREERHLESKIRQIDSALRDSRLFHLWTSHVGKVSGQAYSESKGRESLRSVVTSCLHGHQPCIEDARILHQSGNKSLIDNHDLKRMALFLYGRTDKFAAADDISLEAALVASDGRLSKLNEYLDRVRAGTYGRRAFVSLYTEVAKYQAVQNQLWHWFRGRIRELQVFSRLELEEMFERTVEHIHGKANIDDVLYIGRETGVFRDEFTHRRISHKLFTNQHWLERNEKVLEGHLKRKNAT